MSLTSAPSSSGAGTSVQTGGMEESSGLAPPPVAVEFPTQLYHSYGNSPEVQSSITMRLRMLYLALSQTVLTDVPLTHRLSQSFQQIVQDEQVSLPGWMVEQFCPYCRCFLVIGKTCNVRVRHRTRKSKLNRDKQLKPKVKNEVLMRCLQCNKVAFRAPGYVNKKVARLSKKAKGLPTSASQGSNLAAVTPNKSDRPMAAGETASGKKPPGSLPVSTSKTSLASGSGAVATGNNAKKGFSFLNSVSSTGNSNKPLPNSASKSNFTSLTSALSTNSLASSSSAKKGKASTAPPAKGTLSGNLDFIPLASLVPSLGAKRAHDLAVHAGAHQKAKSGAPSTVPVDNNGKLDLFELERQNKKKKRKSLE